MAHKYCRYCAFCICGDTYYCTALDKTLHNIKIAVNCSEFALSELGDIDTGKPYKPRQSVPICEEGEQLTLDGRSMDNG